MKKILFLLAFIPSLVFAQNQVKNFVISGNVTGLEDGDVKITTTNDDHRVIATGKSVNGVFTVQGSVPEPGLFFLVMSNEQPQYVFLENVPITISGNKSDIKNIKIEGSASHKDFIQFNKIFNPLIGELNAFAAQLQREPDEVKRDKMLDQYDSVVKIISIEVGKFVSSRRSSFVSPFLLWVTAQVLADPIVTESHYNLLDESIKKSQVGKDLASMIAFQKVGAVGTDALDFTQNDVEGKPVSLSSFKGKYVLVDFWASWCGPCRKENPNLVKAYTKFKDKNFTVLGVSLDKQKDAWVKAINTDRLTWSHVSDLKFWDNAVAKMYHIQSIPGNFLIDPNGKIIARDLHGAELEDKLCQVIGGCDVKKPGEKGSKLKERSPKG